MLIDRILAGSRFQLSSALICKGFASLWQFFCSPCGNTGGGVGAEDCPALACGLPVARVTTREPSPLRGLHATQLLLVARMIMRGDAAGAERGTPPEQRPVPAFRKLHAGYSLSRWKRTSSGIINAILRSCGTKTTCSQYGRKPSQSIGLNPCPAKK